MVAMEILRGKDMSSVNVYTNIDVDIELTNEERDTLIHACKILHGISQDMWNDDAEDTENFNRVYEAKESMRDFLRRDIGVELNNKGEVISV